MGVGAKLLKGDHKNAPLKLVLHARKDVKPPALAISFGQLGIHGIRFQWTGFGTKNDVSPNFGPKKDEVGSCKRSTSGAC